MYLGNQIFLSPHSGTRGRGGPMLLSTPTCGGFCRGSPRGAVRAFVGLAWMICFNISI